jgi:hypothetical protein
MRCSLSFFISAATSSSGILNDQLQTPSLSGGSQPHPQWQHPAMPAAAANPTKSLLVTLFIVISFFVSTCWNVT